MLQVVALRVFYDGSGKADDPGCRFVTLGSFAGTEAAWSDFKTQWHSVLVGHQAPVSKRGNPYFHSKDAMNRKGSYASWTSATVAALVNGLFKVIATRERSDVIAISCSVKLDDYRSMKEDIPALRQPEAICIDMCLGTALQHPARGSGIELYFDRGETFCPILKKIWKHKDHSRSAWWSSCVSRMTEVDDMRDEPEIQAADLLAWLANRYHTRGNEDAWGWQFFRTFVVKGHYHSFIDQNALRCLFDSEGRMKPDAKLPAVSIKAPSGTIQKLSW